MIKIKFELRKTLLFLGVLLIANGSITAQIANSNNKLSNSDTFFIKENLNFLASDLLKGRHPGTAEDSIAAYFIAGKMKEMGLVPLIGDSFVIPFNMSLHREVMSNSYVKVAGNELIRDYDYSISPLSPNITFKGRVSKDTSAVSINSEKIIALIRSPKDSISFKITPLIEKGFSAVLFYDKAAFSPFTNLKGPQSTIPVIMISANYANNLLNNNNTICEISSNIREVIAKTYNISGITPGNKGKYIMAGAHYDHLGMGGNNSGSMDPSANKIHPGADDNASGVSSVLEIGRLMSKEISSNGKIAHNKGYAYDGNHENYQYDIAISAFGAEEKGLVGSTILADTLMKLNRLPSLMINLDMVGRLKENKLQAGGAGTFIGADSLLAESNVAAGFELIITKEGMGPSDHSSFYSKKVPVLYFTTGVHKQYHTPADSSALINFEGLTVVTSYVTDIVRSINSSSFVPIYNYVPQQTLANERANFKVTLGVIPDFTYEKGDGFRIGPVSPGKPANDAGLVEGDLIIKIGDKKINNIYDYMSSLGDLKKGENVQIIIIREGAELIKEVNL